jgi:uncharacterized membrane protein
MTTPQAAVKGVSAMPQAVRTHARAPRVTLNSDGQRHTVQNVFVVLACIGGIVAFVISIIVRLHLAATVLGMASFGGGMYLQMTSSTREQRVLLMAGIIGGFVGLGLGIAHGGFG